MDVDDTYLCGDLLAEGLARLLASAPQKIFLLPFWLAAGRPTFKRRVADAVALDPDTLVFNPAVADMIASARNEGRWERSLSFASINRRDNDGTGHAH